MIYYIYFFYLVIWGVGGFMLSMNFLLKKIIYYLEFEIIKFISIKMEFLILLDWMSMMFISGVIFISCMVILYSIEYMSEEIYINRFMNLVLLFVFSMVLMILSPNMVSILFGWDGLGLVSYCLVIYYQNVSSFNSGMVTVLTNRLGDILILMIIGMLTSLGSWNFMFFEYTQSLIIFMIILASITKSAQIPFSTWLPMAMAAPTPVSSLVHSSTLVTAGVYLLIRFSYLIKDESILKMLMLISSLTMLMSGLAANFENDLKKIIAFSTLSQLGVMIFCLTINLPEFAFFHLLTHAMFKSMLFLCAGVIIHNYLGNQDIRVISAVSWWSPLVALMFNCSSLSLCGFPFLSGFYSKDLILEMFLMNYFNKFIFIILFISMGLTVSYSVRLIFFTFVKIPNINYFLKYSSLSSFMTLSMFFLFFMTNILGSSLSWMMFSLKNEIFLPLKFKLMIYFFMILGLMLGGGLNFYIKSNIFFLNNLYFKYFLFMWFLSILYINPSKKILFQVQNLMKIDLSWNEYIMGVSIWDEMKKIMGLDFFNKNYFYLLIYIIYFLFFLLFINF